MARTAIKKPKRRSRIRAAVWLAILAFFLASFLPYVHHKTVSSDYARSLQTQEYLSDQPGPERILCVDENEDALAWRFRLMEEAKQELIYVSFDFADDESGADVLACLLHAAQRGVHVKVLTDGFPSALALPGSEAFQALASSPNVEMKVYNPFRLTGLWKNQARMHDKYLIVDQQLYLLGGRNTSDYFLGSYQENGNLDREVLVLETEPETENSLSSLRQYFSDVWALDVCRPYAPKDSEKAQSGRQALETRYLALQDRYGQDVDWEAVTQPVNKITLLHNPIEADNKEPRLWYALTELMKNEKEVFIQTPYVICSRAMYDRLRQVQNTGTQISILTNAPETGANLFGTSDLRWERKKILNTGAVVYEFSGNRSNHTKSILIGDRISVIGSFNMDMRSTYLDTELMLVIDSASFQQQMRQIVEEELAQSRCLQKDGTYLYGESYTGKADNPMVVVLSTLLGLISRPFRILL